jgi:hypothetical protein
VAAAFGPRSVDVRVAELAYPPFGSSQVTRTRGSTGSIRRATLRGCRGVPNADAPLGTVGDGLAYPGAFGGGEAVDKTGFIIKKTDRGIALLLRRALDAQHLYHAVTPNARQPERDIPVPRETAQAVYERHGRLARRRADEPTFNRPKAVASCEL